MAKEKLKLAKIAFTILITLAFLQQASTEKQIQLQESSQCGNIVCEAGENRTNCAIDCGSALSHIQFSDMVKIFEIAFYRGRATGIEGIDFFIGAGVGYEQGSDSDKYCYLSATNNHNHYNWSKSEAKTQWAFVSLNDMDIDNIYAQYQDSGSKVRKGILQRKDIEKFCTENYPAETCSEIKFGVQTDGKLNLIVDENNNPITDSPIEDYQNGKTIVYPFCYHSGDGLDSRPFYNFNNPVVRAYAIELVLKTQEKCGTNHIFMDNFMPRDEFFYKNNQNRFYVSSGTMDEQIETHISQLLEMLKKVKERNPDTKFSLNGYSTPDDESKNKFIEIATSPEQKDNFEMIMFEDRFCDDKYGLCTAIDKFYGNKGYYYYVKKLHDAGKNTLLAATMSIDSRDPANYKAYKIWLLANLIGNDKTYIYINDIYTSPMINYITYSYKLGQPLGEPHKEDPDCQVNCTWLREFERGTIVFDTTSKKLDAIKFIEDTSQACGNNTCDTDIGETTESCPADCLTSQCGNNQCDEGETFETCPADCPQECIREPQLLDFIGQWKRGEISMLVLMQKMRQWRAGTGC